MADSGFPQWPAARIRGIRLTMLIGLWFTTATAQVSIEEFAVERPRPFGYVIGDRQQHVIHLVLTAPHRLVEDNLPVPGRIGRFLALTQRDWTVERTGAATVHRIELLYQLIGVPETAATLEIPALELAYTDGRQIFGKTVPSWAFRVAPLTPPLDPAAAAAQTIRPQRGPERMDLRVHERVVLAAGGLFLLLALVFATQVWRERADATRHPFAAAYRALRGLRRRPDGPERTGLALTRLHAAFDQTAGRAVFADDLGALFRRHDDLMPLRETIEALYAQSRRIHFTEPDSKSSEGLSFEHMLRLCRRCRDLERRRR
jgi:mxaA protein